MYKNILDGNVFDYLVDNNISFECLKEIGMFFTSIIQRSEIGATNDPIRRKILLDACSSLPQRNINFDLGILTDNIIINDDQMLVDVPSEFIYEYTYKFENKPWMDALLVEIAKHHNLILVTNDKAMSKKARQCNIKTMEGLIFAELIQMRSSD